tara:strand:+ start:34 stop:1287 length:1254 start_codon:yes stop_codon:yes gene_type:complete
MRFKLSAEAAEIAETLKEFELKEAEEAAKEVALLERSVHNLQVGLVRAESKLQLHKSRRNDIDRKIKDLDLKRARLLSSYEHTDRRIYKYRDKANSLATQERAKGLTLSRAKDASVRSSDAEELASRVAVLLALSEHIDTGITIVFENDKLKWRTGYIRFKDGLGGWTDTSFGKFDVAVHLRTYDNGVQEIEVWAQVCEGTANRYDGYPHPHIDSNGKVCLGDVQAPLRDAMKEKDFTKSIILLTELFTTYNRESPYVTLSRWERNVFDNPELKCSCGVGNLHTTIDCSVSAACSSCADRFLIDSGMIEDIKSFNRADEYSNYRTFSGKCGICTSCKASKLAFSPFWDKHSNKRCTWGAADSYARRKLLLGTGWHFPHYGEELKVMEQDALNSIEEYEKHLTEQEKLREIENGESSE